MSKGMLEFTKIDHVELNRCNVLKNQRHSDNMNIMLL